MQFICKQDKYDNVTGYRQYTAGRIYNAANEPVSHDSNIVMINNQGVIHPIGMTILPEYFAKITIEGESSAMECVVLCHTDYPNFTVGREYCAKMLTGMYVAAIKDDVGGMPRLGRRIFDKHFRFQYEEY